MPTVATLIRRTEYSLVYSAFHALAAGALIVPNATLVTDSAGLMNRLLQTEVLNAGAMERLFGSDFATNGAFFDNPNILYIEISVQPTTYSISPVNPFTARPQLDGALDRADLEIGQRTTLAALEAAEAEIRLQVRHTFNR